MCGENILELAGDAEDLLSVVLCMKKTERKNKNRQHANSQQRDDRVKVCAAWQRGAEGRGGDGLETEVRSWRESMQTVAHFIAKRRRSKRLVVACQPLVQADTEPQFLHRPCWTVKPDVTFNCLIHRQMHE